MTTKTKYIIAITSVSVLGLGYFIYSKIKIAKLNNQIKSVPQVDEQINNIDVDNTDIEPTEPELPLPSETEDSSSAYYSQYTEY